MVWVNAPLLENDAGPFGGRKQSGMGRQLGAEGLEMFRHTKLSLIRSCREGARFLGGFHMPTRGIPCQTPWLSSSALPAHWCQMIAIRPSGCAPSADPPMRSSLDSSRRRPWH